MTLVCSAPITASMDLQRSYRRRYLWGQVNWLQPGHVPLWVRMQQKVTGKLPDDNDRDHFWRPPLLRPSDDTVSDKARKLLREAGYVRADIVANPTARMFYVHEQLARIPADSPLQDALSGCTWCGKLTGNFCDGVLPSARARGRSCRFSMCSTCESVLGTCRHCSLWRGLPKEVTEIGR